MAHAQVRCRLSRRQRRLYDEYMTSGETRSTLAGGNFMGIISCLMQLRKVRALGLGLEGFRLGIRGGAAAAMLLF
jgi:hypothetical protein